MKMIAGAIVVLAGAVLGAAAIVAYAIPSSRGLGEAAATIGGVFGAAVGILGLVLLLGSDVGRWRARLSDPEEEETL